MDMLKKLGFLALCLTMVAPAFGQTRNENPQAVGLDVLIPDTAAFAHPGDNAANWEAYADVMGDGSLIFVVNTMDANGTEGTERPGVVVVSPDLSVAEYAGYYADDGTPYTDNVDTVRQDGNPPQIGGDRRAGMSRYIVGDESTPYNFPAFDDGRWVSGYTDHFYCVQAFDLTATGPSPLFNVIDPFYGEQDVVVEKGRTGGVAGLDNGNWVCEVEDRGGNTSGNSKAPILSIINGDTGAIIKGPFVTREDAEVNTDGWDGLTSMQGGFAHRINGGETSIGFYDNAGTQTGRWFQDTLLDDVDQPVPLDPANNPGGFTTTISTTGRGDGNHICAAINSTNLYYAARGFDPFSGAAAGAVYLVKIDTQTGTTVKEALVNELVDLGGPYDNVAAPNRVTCYADRNDNVVVAWSDTANSGAQQVVARIFNSDLEPVTESFLAFQASTIDGVAGAAGVETFHPQCAITQNGILFTARTTAVPTADGGTHPANTHLFTVVSNPLATPVGGWDLY